MLPDPSGNSMISEWMERKGREEEEESSDYKQDSVISPRIPAEPIRLKQSS